MSLRKSLSRVRRTSTWLKRSTRGRCSPWRHTGCLCCSFITPHLLSSHVTSRQSSVLLPAAEHALLVINNVACLFKGWLPCFFAIRSVCNQITGVSFIEPLWAVHYISRAREYIFQEEGQWSFDSWLFLKFIVRGKQHVAVLQAVWKCSWYVF